MRHEVFIPEGLTEDWLMARVRVDGDCLIWTGWADNGGKDPRCSIDCVKNINLRRTLWAMLHMRKPAHDCSVVPCCGFALCVRPEHLSERQKGWGQRGKPKTITHRAAIAETKRKASTLPQEQVADIIASELSGPKEAALRGLSKDMINRIRAGQLRQDYRTPWAQLL